MFLFLPQIWDLADPDGKGFLDKQVKHAFYLLQGLNKSSITD